MSRKSLIRSQAYPYHVTGRSNNREVFHCPLNLVWAVFSQEFFEARTLFGVEIHAFVLMPNHFRHYLQLLAKTWVLSCSESSGP